MSITKLFKSRTRPADRFEQLISPHISSLYRYAYRLSQSSDGAEELVQLLLTRLFHKLEELEKVEILRPWLTRSLYNLYVDGYRKQQRTLSVISPEEMPEEAVSMDKTPFETTELNQQQQIIQSALQLLNEDQRIVIQLHDAEGYTLSELADSLQTPIGTLKSRLHRARSLLREKTEMELFGEQSRVNSIEDKI